MSDPKGLKLSELPILQTVSGEEYVEVIHREGDGPYDNYRVLVSKIGNVDTAYDFAVSNGFVGTLAEWLACTQAIYARDPAKFGMVLMADAQGVAQWTAISGLIDGLEEEFNLILLQARAAADNAANSAIAANISAEVAAATVVAITEAKEAAEGFATTAQNSVTQANAAKDAAEAAVPVAQSAVGQAQAARDASSGFADAAAESATEAQEFAQGAALSRNAAETAVGQAQLAAQTAEEVVATVTASVDTAVQAASDAQTAAGQAVAAKDLIVPLVATVETSVAQAVAAKDTAATSATAAVDAALQSGTARDAAQGFANDAGDSADASNNSADAAAVSVTEALGARDASEAFAVDALASVTETQADVLEAVIAKTASETAAGQALAAKIAAEAAVAAAQGISVARFGATGVGNETVAFTATCTAAVAAGHKRVCIPFPAFTVTDNTDCLGCEIIGSTTVLTGSLQNFASLKGVVINNRNANDRRIHPAGRADLASKLIKKIDDTYTQVYVPKKSKGYVMIEMRNNVTTGSDSLAAGNGEINTHRVVAVTNCVDVLVGYKTSASSTGTWTTPFLITGIAEAVNGGIQYTYLQGAAGTAGIYYEMSIVVPSDGYFNVGFLCAAAACPDVSVWVDGVVIDANFSTVAASAIVEVRQYKARPGTRVIRVVKNVVTGLLNLLGCNFSKLATARNDVSISHSGYYRNSDNYKDYINSTSANGYALRDKLAAVWGGEYHGGESAIVERFLIDGTLSALAVAQVAVCKSLSIRAEFNIDFVPRGGSLLKMRKSHDFCIGGYTHSLSVLGPMRMESAFTTLVGVNPNFDRVLSPVMVDLSALADSTRHYFGRQNQVVYGCGTTDQRLSITHSTFTEEDSEKGGAYIYKNLNPGNYHKYYYGAVDRGDRTFLDLYAINVIEFD